MRDKQTPVAVFPNNIEPPLFADDVLYTVS